ncbi:carboxypeptidase-like regulatory domain-containing protein, partial [Patescibacteria group bacterium]|nr:carboxypeptidase-like regulatory domain-containing protein [Patescibacteria group bacterium]
YTISGTVTLNDINQTYMPIRAVKYDDNGNYTGQEYGGQTDASGVYSISIPPGKYRVDIWTPEFGEVELTVTDEAVNNPANVIITNANKTGKDITITSASLKTITLAFTNGSVSQTAIINIDGVSGTPPKPTGFNKTIKLSTSVPSSSVKLPDGDYMFYINVPGSGGFTPTGGNPVTVSADATVTFVLPDGATELFTVSGKITGPGNIEGAWVWMGSPTTGVHLGDATDSNGDYTITLKAGTYKMGVEMPGFIPQTPTSIVVSADAPATDYTLTAANQFITGRIYADANSNNSYDSGEAVANGWVWVEETTTKKIAGAPTALDGVFSIGVGDGTYILRGAAEGYAETKFGSPVTTSGLGASNKNIKLTVDANWSSKLKSKPMTPASGGTMDDSLSAGTGVKLVVPPNALGSGTSSGNIKTNEVSSVSKTSSAQPLGGKGKEITAQNNSGQAITTLNSDIEIELNYYKEDITEAGLVDFTKLKTLTNSYWDTSIGDWVPISTTKKAYTKAVGAAANAEWTTQTNFDTFADALAGNANTYGDYKITLKSTTGHLTIFGATTPSDLIAPAAPAGLSQTSGSGTSVALDWSNNSEADLLEYEIYRSTSSGVTAIDANQVNTSQVAASAFTDLTTTAWTSYYYTVTAADDSGNESSVATEIRVCSNKTVSNGTVAATCAITCDSGYTQSGNSCAVNAPSGGGGYVNTTPASTTGQVAATSSLGGTVSKTNSDGSKASISLPANALTSNATVTIVPTIKASVTATRPVLSGKTVIGNYVYNFTAVNASNAEVNTFAKALTLTLTYTNEQVAGLNEGALKIYYWNETSSAWVALGDSAVNTTANTVTATTTHFTYFAILGSQASEETSAPPETPAIPAADIIDGDIIQCQTCSDPFAVYIVKVVGGTKYIRHIVSLEIFNHYGHLDWNNLKQVSSLNNYSLSGWVRYNTGANGTAGPNDKVYEINGDQTKHWVNMTAEQFLTHGGSDPAIYTVNQGELSLYSTGADVMSL